MTSPQLDDLDVIRIVGLTAHGRHGVYPSERQHGQPFQVDVTMYVDTRQAANCDCLSETVDYSEVAHRVAQVLSGDPVNLIETLAQKVANTVLAWKPVKVVDVEVHKPHAPMELEFSDVTMMIRRWRSETKPADSPLKKPTPKPASHPPQPELSKTQNTVNAAPQNHDYTTVNTPSRRNRNHPASPTKTTRLPHRATLAFGGNQTDPALTFAKTIQTLDNAPEFNVKAVSGLFLTAAILAPGQDPQPDYLNAVIVVETELDPHQLLTVTQFLETEAGRVRTGKWQARPLDIDLITFDDLVINADGLTVPHPRAAERAFVLAPWEQVAPDATWRGKPIAQLLADKADQRCECVAETWVEEALAGRLELPTGTRSDAPPATQLTAQRNEPESTEPAPLRESPARRRVIDPDDEDIYRPRQTPTIVGDHLGTPPATTPTTPVLRPNLPENFATGLLPITGESKKLSRRTVVRPTLTGMQPIIINDDTGEE